LGENPSPSCTGVVPVEDIHHLVVVLATRVFPGEGEVVVVLHGKPVGRSSGAAREVGGEEGVGKMSVPRGGL
jgi:hypothetical protein